MIDLFRGKYYWLSNFYHSLLVYEGFQYPSVENAFQAAKVFGEDRKKFQFCSAAEAKKLGRKVKLRSDWEKVKFSIMKEILRAKFSNPILRRKLLETGNEVLVEGNTWGDRVWGVCNGSGQNWLGKLLMKIREEIRNADSIN